MSVGRAVCSVGILKIFAPIKAARGADIATVPVFGVALGRSQHRPKYGRQVWTSMVGCMFSGRKREVAQLQGWTACKRRQINGIADGAVNVPVDRVLWVFLVSHWREVGFALAGDTLVDLMRTGVVWGVDSARPEMQLGTSRDHVR